MNGARTTPWEGLVHRTGTVLDMEAVEDIDEACWLTITVDFLIYPGTVNFLQGSLTALVTTGRW